MTEQDQKTTARPRAYRPELQGLRALACLLVVIYHVWLGRVSGGVDVFFLITGFLITGQLVRAVGRGGIEFRPMWARMIKRLFPASLTVLVAVMAVAVVALPENRWFQTIHEVVASALYLENWQLAADSTNYFAQHDTASVVQHFWSLSIQGQFYLVWPLLIAGVAFAARAAHLRLRAVLTTVFLVLFAVSLAFSVWLTAADQPLAYFHALTRVWEFALGGLLALGIDAISLPKLLRVVLGWLGVAGLVSCGLVLTVGTQFPGYLALWPTMSALLVLVAGATGSAAGADRWLASRGMRYLGDLSYALYLWHWPVLVFYLVIKGQTEVGLRGGAFIVGFSLLLAALTHRFVEEPARRARFTERTRWATYRFGVAMLVPVLALAGAWQVVSADRAGRQAQVIGDPDHPGAQSLRAGFEYQGSPEPPLTPSFLSVAEDYARIGDEHCGLKQRLVEVEICTTADSAERPPPEKRIAVVGDSHAQQVLGALLPIAEKRNWQVSSMLRGGCPFSTDSETVPGDQPCMDWNASVIEELAETQPDVVVTIGSRDVRPGVPEYTPPGYVAQWRNVELTGIPVVAVRDNPRFDDFWPSVCVEDQGVDAPDCSMPRGDLFAAVAPYLEVPDVPSNVSFVDLSDQYCMPEVCPPVIGNVLVYLDNNHVTATYMSTMSDIVEEALVSELGWDTSG